VLMQVAVLLFQLLLYESFYVLHWLVLDHLPGSIRYISTIDAITGVYITVVIQLR
jgi:hypothetical protein